MSNNPHIIAVVQAAEAYLAGRLEGQHLVRCVDDFVANGHLNDCDPVLRSLIDEFQDELSLYVRDEITKREAPGVYYTDDMLKVQVSRFLEKLAAL